MRARTFVFALVFGTATVALAQSGAYVRFASATPQNCAAACASDRMCASWSFGTSARSYGQNQSLPENAGMCTLSGSSVVRNSPGIVSGLPQRAPVAVPAPIIIAPSNQNASNVQRQNTQIASGAVSSGISRGASGWDVRPAPWLSGQGSSPQQSPRTEEPSGPPQILRPAPPVFVPPPVYVPPVVNVPPAAYVPPPISIAPSQPALVRPTPRLAEPAPPPGTQEMQSRVSNAPLPTPAQRPQPEVARNSVTLPLSSRPTPAQATQSAPPPPTVAPVVPASGAAPQRQEIAVRPTPGPTRTRAPVLDASNPESFRGADGMIDAAEMRRAQLNAAREQGTPVYSVQREWEAIETERQRALAAGEVRVDPLAGSAPVPPPPETRAQRRLREAEEALLDAEEARAAAQDRVQSSDTSEASQGRSRRPPGA